MPESSNSHNVRLMSTIVGILACTIREMPENAYLVEKIVFDEKVDLVKFLKHNSNLLRYRTCVLLRILGRFSCASLQTKWSSAMRETLEALVYDSDEQVRNVRKTKRSSQRNLNWVELMTKFCFSSYLQSSQGSRVGFDGVQKSLLLHTSWRWRLIAMWRSIEISLQIEHCLWYVCDFSCNFQFNKNLLSSSHFCSAVTNFRKKAGDKLV